MSHVPPVPDLSLPLDGSKPHLTHTSKAARSSVAMFGSAWLCLGLPGYVWVCLPMFGLCLAYVWPMSGLCRAYVGAMSGQKPLDIAPT